MVYKKGGSETNVTVHGCGRFKTVDRIERVTAAGNGKLINEKNLWVRAEHGLRTLWVFGMTIP